jgi:hypothetical protein
MGSWNVIQARLQVHGAAGSSGSFGFGAALTVGVGLLLGLATYSALDSQPESAQATNIYPAKVVNDTPEEPVFQVNNENGELANAEAVSEPVFVDEPKDEVFTDQNEIPEVSRSEFSSVNSRESDVAVAPDQDAPLAVAALRPAAAVGESEKVLEIAPQILTSSVPDDIAPEKAPFAAAIRTSGSFGYAPFTVDFEVVGNPAGQVWDFGPYGKSTDSHPTVVFDKPGLYSVMLSAYRGENEQKIEFVTIEVEEGSSFFMPNSFTPDGDGQNDVFLAKGTKLQSFQMTIVNSKGSVVFQSLDIDAPWVFDHAVHGQDGEFYIAIVRAKGLDGKEYNNRQRLNIIY